MKVIKNNQVVNEVNFDLEKDIQKTIEDNLENIFGYELIKHEFTINNRRIDTLAYDRENKAFIIIEYKKIKSKSVVDQGHAYLALLSKNKAAFVLAYIEAMNEKKLEKDFDWTQTLIVFIAPKYMDYSKEATSLRGLPFQLWKVYKFEGDIVVLNQIIVEKAPDFITDFTRYKPTIVSKPKEDEIEIHSYDLNYHLKMGSDEIKEMYAKFEAEIQLFDNRIETKFNKQYIAFKISNRNFCSFHIQKKEIVCYLNIPFDTLSKFDPKHKAVQFGKTEGKNLCRFKITSQLSQHYAMLLIEASFNYNFGRKKKKIKYLLRNIQFD